MYIDNFLLASNTMALLKELKEYLAKEYDTNNFEKVKTIIGWQISQDMALGTIKINQSVFIRDFVIEESLTKCNANVILMKAGSVIDIGE